MMPVMYHLTGAILFHDEVSEAIEPAGVPRRVGDNVDHDKEGEWGQEALQAHVVPVLY